MTAVTDRVDTPTATPTPPRRRFGLVNAFSHTVLVGWAVLTTFPLIWAILSAFKSDKEILTSAWGLPTTLHFDNWSRAWNEAHIGRYFLNTAVVVAGALLLTLMLGAMAA